MGWGAVIGGLAAATNFMGQKDANQMSEDSVSKQIAFQDDQSRTQYQRAVTDMKAAGINPVLASQVGGNSSSSGASTSFQAPQIDMPGIMAARNNELQLQQQQERINIEKGLAASTIAKNTTDQQLTKAKTLVEKGGILSKYGGSNAGEAVDYLRKKYREYRNPLQTPNFNQKPINNGPTE